MTEALLALPAHLRERLAHALDSGTLAPPYGAAAVGAAVGGASQSAAVARAVTELHGLGVSGRGCAAWLRGLDPRRMDATPGLSVTLLLNVQRKKGDTTDADHLVRRFADRFRTEEWPGSARPRVFYDPRSLDPDGSAGVLHAKAVVVDEAVFVTSANLTEAALDRNIEIGLLVRDRTRAATMTRHFTTLIERSLLRPLPA